MDLRQMEYFQMVSKLNNITKAAESLGVTQPSITVALKKLEDELGVTLINRNQRKITLTSEGEVFLKRVEKIFNEVDDAKKEMKDFQELDKGIINLGIPMMTGSYLFPDIFSGFKHFYPHIDFSIVEDGSIELSDLLEEGSLDLAIILLNDIPDTLETIIIQENELVACLPFNHPLADREKVSIDDLKNEKLILFRENTLHRKKILDLFREKNYEPNIILSSSQIETIHSLVINEMGATFLLDFVAKTFSDMVAVPLEHSFNVKIVLAWKKSKYISLASQAFINFIKENYSMDNREDK